MNVGILKLEERIKEKLVFKNLTRQPKYQEQRLVKKTENTV